MLAKISNSHINFGWKGATHQALSQAASNAVNKEECGSSACTIFNTNEITLASTLPDREKHAQHSHSADITSLKDGDAFCMFKEYDKKIKSEILKKNSPPSELIGRSLHYLQDMMDPPHAMDYLEITPSRKDKLAHLQIENDAVKLQHYSIKYAKNLPSNSPTDFEKFLISKMTETKEIYSEIKQVVSKKMNSTNLKELETLELKGLANSYQVTYEYLKEISKYLRVK